MEAAVKDELCRMVDEYATDEALNGLLKAFIREKENDDAMWSEMTRTTHQMLGGDSPLLDRHAALTELIVLLLDIVDDLQDRDSPQRPWMTGDPAMTLNAVLVMFAAILGSCGRDVAPRIASLLARSIDGQQADIAGTVTTEEQYFNMVASKSGALVELAVYMGYALVDGIDPAHLATLDQLAVCAGIVSQIENDARDVLRLDYKNDIIHRKRTLPILFLLEDSHAEYPELDSYYAGGISQEAFRMNQPALVQYVRDSGCIEYCKVVQALYKDKASELYALLPPLEEPWAGRFRDLFVPDYEAAV
ncbi:polyprenyl synthetase family protein [Cohnella sp. JJ-181]|uniref:polyprenyl synthetase family protein n=1 Tax=Cohnella rhizoplanae TaxID=2974897 RepID=UPI0022FFC231|nr:polyprenyl synthetase family protein [Cohnella sp. JJ-181]CAI6085026.1 hypothetical protein COHCIP112018_04534 [Cohnella sp. JJ-181]